MELQVGDRITDETREWEVIRQPYTTGGGRIVHARVQKINEPVSWEIRSWDASSASAWGGRALWRARDDATRTVHYWFFLTGNARSWHATQRAA